MVRKSCTIILLVAWAGMLFGQTPFVDVTQSAGIEHTFKVYEGMFGGGICVFDLNNDGFEDLYLTSGMNEDVLYLNNGDGTFKNIYEGSGLELTRHYVTQGVVGADINRDGWVDLFITTITSKDSVKTIPREINLLFLNQGDNTFRDVTSEFGLDQMYSFSTGANFGDVNGDGYPDLYVGNYFHEYEGGLNYISDATIVAAHQTSKGYLLINQDGRRFENEYEEYGLSHKGFGFGGIFTDFDNDGDQDLLVNHDFGYKRTPNLLLENLYPKKKFVDVADSLAMDLKINAMGAAVGDVNEDGLLDYFITNIRFNRFMVSQGPGKPFVDKLKEMQLHQLAISWGANFADFDHDGDLDLFVANGDLNPNCVPMGNFYFENNDGKFVDNARPMGLADYGLGRGSVVFDYDNDGDLDLLVINQEAVYDYPVESTTKLFRNDLAKGNWVKVKLEGNEAETHGLGSRVEVVAGGKHQLREIDGGGSSHLSQNSTIAHFGLGTADRIDSLIITWTGGEKQVLLDQPVNEMITVVEPERPGMGTMFYVSFFAVLIGIAFFAFRAKGRSKMAG
ncbi:CRTAC1 family protein [Flavilitoribacter nigricans]|uniref:ASPIC/UnbV domain-containing protein n=1 Tax=Flavilitoribacter nigricans (strain ATCC 23147 / DSM 23189 / NBRC 102662 / NCIMB 1420 / SS-2) TaxID=1122177 RepID=A0A2D0MZY5_FLAN2|nr:CRTAC1 family protein [Flavilitoribacter nigricans]PHN01459.1 hypothetical protein CRP01_36770 [Flavilitoribacter nigricans DSM 23189 = NBRC 102662]